MSKLAAFAVVALTAVSVFAHAGHVHNYLGTVKVVDASHLEIVTTDSKTVDVAINESTKFLRYNGEPARKADLKPGVRVSLYVSEDGKTATKILLPPR
ncbi:MAG TPA: hypothetical protein VLV78_12990 [Thermoanaerobaculia bacterium]|nr:hypothetical protein [Thermoanaerobaculia bacterium]